MGAPLRTTRAPLAHHSRTTGPPLGHVSRIIPPPLTPPLAQDDGETKAAEKEGGDGTKSDEPNGSTGGDATTGATGATNVTVDYALYQVSGSELRLRLGTWDRGHDRGRA